MRNEVGENPLPSSFFRPPTFRRCAGRSRLVPSTGLVQLVDRVVELSRLPGQIRTRSRAAQPITLRTASRSWCVNRSAPSGQGRKRKSEFTRSRIVCLALVMSFDPT